MGTISRHHPKSHQRKFAQVTFGISVSDPITLVEKHDRATECLIVAQCHRDRNAPIADGGQSVGCQLNNANIEQNRTARGTTANRPWGLSVFSSANQPVQLPVDDAGFRTSLGVAAHRSLGGQSHSQRNRRSPNVRPYRCLANNRRSALYLCPRPLTVPFRFRPSVRVALQAFA